VFVSIIFAGIESAADAASIVIDVDHNNGYEIHGSTHAESHEHNGTQPFEALDDDRILSFRDVASEFLHL
jgi:hypothetical protein